MRRHAGLAAMLALLVASMLSTQALAHNVPGAVTALVFLKPAGDHLTLLVRAPTQSLRDIDIPMRENGFLDLARIGEALRFGAQVWIRDFIEVYENGERLPRPDFVAARATLATDRPFETFDEALAAIEGAPLDPAIDLTWEQGFVEVAYRYPIVSEHSRFAIDPGLTRLGVHVNVLVRMVFADGRERLFDVSADVGRIELDPTRWQTFALFAKEGFRHILGDTDYLLFLFALVLPFRHLRPLVIVVGGFTVAHSLTLIAAASGLAPDAPWFGPLVHALVAASILCVALDNLFGATARRRLWAAFGFGLVYGFAFAFLLLDKLQFAGSHPLTAVLSFNLGLELGQLLALAVMVPLLALAFRRFMPEGLGVALLSALVAHATWHATAGRAATLLLFPFPEMDAQALTRLIWWVIAAVSMAAVLWFASGPARRFADATPEPRRVPPGE